LGYQGDVFTWTNNQEGEHHIKERLDSDFMDDANQRSVIKRMENIWLKDPRCHQIIKREWSQTSGDTNTKLQTVFDKIFQWGNTTYGNVPRQMKHTQSMIQDLQVKTPTKANLDQIKNLESKLDATQRNRKNKINFIKDTAGILKTDNGDIQRTFMDYFNELFTSSNPTNMLEAIKVVADKITPSMFSYLNQDFTATEVSHATHQLKGNAAPGSDGLNANFFQVYWDILGDDLSKIVLNILNDGGNPESLNHTFICLIPKHKNPSIPTDYRLIALCNVILKIITKTIANRIKGILPDIISPQQSTFLPGKLITDNTLIAFETFHHLKLNKNKKKGYVGIKLDMAKAYDRIKW
ncbi:hypothetical protein A2U01_0008194, partial [Trifolium medium]|nr:hypothetical protein [Trifolium medium]